MAGSISDFVIDFGLDVLDNEATHIVLCEVEPTAYRLCSIGAANCLGYKSFGAGNAFDGPSAHRSMGAMLPRRRLQMAPLSLATQLLGGQR